MDHEEPSQPRVILTAYACDPELGSESGAGWAMLQAVAEIASEVLLITRAQNAPLLENAVAELPADVHVLRIPTRFDYQGNSYTRYIAWLIGTSRVVHRKISSADIVHHVTFAADWMPPPFPLLDSPAKKIWGPAGGNTYPPFALIRRMNRRFVAKELVRWLCTSAARTITRRWLSGRIDTFLALNDDSLRSAPRGAKAMVHPNCILPYPDIDKPRRVRGSSKQALYVGRLLELKGILLAVAAWRLLGDDWTMTVVGDGPEMAKLQAIAAETNGRLNLVGWKPRDQVEAYMLEADVLVFPSLHDSAPFAAAEAASCGLPVVCLNLGGVSQMAGGNALVVDSSPSYNLPARIASAMATAAMGIYDQQRDWTLKSMVDCLSDAYGIRNTPRSTNIDMDLN